jgi:hypothetical protein
MTRNPHQFKHKMRVLPASPTKISNNADQKPSTCVSMGYAITSNKANSSYIGVKAPTISRNTSQNIIPQPITNTLVQITYVNYANQHQLSYTNQYHRSFVRGCVDEHVCTRYARAHSHSSHEYRNSYFPSFSMNTHDHATRAQPIIACTHKLTFSFLLKFPVRPLLAVPHNLSSL